MTRFSQRARSRLTRWCSVSNVSSENPSSNSFGRGRPAGVIPMQKLLHGKHITKTVMIVPHHSLRWFSIITIAVIRIRSNEALPWDTAENRGRLTDCMRKNWKGIENRPCTTTSPLPPPCITAHRRKFVHLLGW